MQLRKWLHSFQRDAIVRYSASVGYLDCAARVAELNYQCRISGKCWLTAHYATPHMAPQGGYWHLSLPPPRLCFRALHTSIHSNQHCLMEIIDFRRFFANRRGERKKKQRLNILSSKSKFRRSPINTLEIKANSLKQTQRVAKDLWAQKKKRREGDTEWNNEWSPSELSFPGRAPLGMQTLSHQKWATYLWKEWLLHPIWFGSPIIS